ncbi:hypothetical protein ACJRBH_001991 [Staphylococcus aureus]
MTRSVAHMQYLLDKVVEAESKEEAERKYEAQVKIRRDGDAKENGND